jgi:hypothetical protein
MFAKLTCSLLLLLAFGAVQANADSLYAITGSMIVHSSNPTANETINYSFVLDYSQNIGSGAPIVGTPVVTSSGALGTFTFEGINWGNAYAVFNSPIASVDLYGYFSTFWSPVPVVGAAVGGGYEGYMYSCTSATVCPQFYAPGGPLPDYSQPGFGAGGLYWNDVTGTAVVNAVQTPEPGSLCLLVLGALALWLVKK